MLRSMSLLAVLSLPTPALAETIATYCGCKRVGDEQACSACLQGGTAHPVATKQPNAFGLHDMLGTVAELVYDAYDHLTPAQGSVDPIRHVLGEGGMAGDRTMCGGDFFEGGHRARAAARQAFPASSHDDQIGFRPVRTK